MMIELKDVSKTYSTDKEVVFYALKNVNLKLENKGLVSILGPSGCGKSTLLNLLGGLDRPTSGHIYVGKKDLSQLKDSEIDIYKNKDIGFVFQNCFLISQLSVLDNIILPLKISGVSDDKSKKKAVELLKRFNIEALKDKKVNQLSGGQAQRVCICRAIINDPKIILADEPTGALDSKSSIDVMELLKEISKDHLVLMVTHNDKLSKEYSTREIRLLDGEINSDDILKDIEEKETDEVIDKKQKNKFSIMLTLKMACKNLVNKMWKSVITSLSNSLGVIGIGFYLALNFGFSNYSYKISRENASSLPVVISSYAVNSQSEEFNKVNASVEYPDVTEIYPSVSTSSTYSYKSNNFSAKYFNYLNKLQDEGTLREYVLSYGKDYSFNLTTTFPNNSVSTVETSTNSYNYYANISSLPSNIFHVLYGDLNSYDLITGKMPVEKNEIVLVVNKYNAVSFNILKNLGFYDTSTTENDVKTGDEKKVKAISFDDVIGKEYKIFSNDEFYTLDNEKTETDVFSHERKVRYYKQNDLDSLYNDSSKGTKLKITGIIRPKADTAINILSPALCYTKSLQEDLMKMNEDSAFSNTYRTNYALTTLTDTKGNNVVSELTDLYTRYQNNEFSDFPTSEYNSIISKYFRFYVPDNEGYIYTSVSAFLSSSRAHSAKIITEELLTDADETYIENKYNEMVANFVKIKALADKKDQLSDDELKEMNTLIEQTYEDVLNFTATLNAYSLIDTVVLFPTTLENRTNLLNKLDEYNEIKENDINHASSLKEQVTYSSENNNNMIENVAEAIALANSVLLMTAIISFLISILMSAFMISNNVLERQKEIGLLRGIGTSKISVSSIFVFESVILGITSGIIGALTTYLFSFPLNDLINKTYPSYKIGKIANFTFPHCLIVIAISMLVSLIASFIPAFLAAKNDPIKSLRSE